MSTTLVVTLIFPFYTHAQEIPPEIRTTEKARVVRIIDQKKEVVEGTDSTEVLQTIDIHILSGEEKGKDLKIVNDLSPLHQGETFYLTKLIDENGTAYRVSDKYRLPGMLLLAAIFILLTAIFGGKQGVRGIASLIGGICVLYFFLLPNIISGHSAILLSAGAAGIIIVFGSYITHGFNKTTTAAVLGMLATIIITGLLATWAIHLTKLSGFDSEEAVYLNLNTSGTLDFAGILLGGIIIGLLGALYDAAISQAIAAEELWHANPAMTKRHMFTRLTRIGREHIGALVNTLAIAYVGAALPLLLLFYQGANAPFHIVLNRELFASEIVRIIVGSIGVVLSVPITNYIVSYILIEKKGAHIHEHSHVHH